MSEGYEFSEFRAPDNDMIAYVLDSSGLLKQFSEDVTQETYRREVLKSASHTMKVMLAMSVGGYHLYCTEAEHASVLADLCTTIYDRLTFADPRSAEDVDISPLLSFRKYREEGLDIDSVPFFADPEE